MDDVAHDIRSQTMYDMNNVKIVTFDRLEENVRKLGKIILGRKRLLYLNFNCADGLHN